jgi:alpha-tubulin suppressor-like RCC1 family protein
VKCWGDNRNGQVGNSSASASTLVPVDVTGHAADVAAVSARSQHTCSVSIGGAVRCWGFNASGQLGNDTRTDSSVPVDVSGLVAGAAIVDVGIDHTCMRRQSGVVSCWGANGFGQLGNDSTVDSLIPVDVAQLGADTLSVTAGGFHNCALMRMGGVKCWGQNMSGQVGDGTTTNATAPVTVIGL